MIYCFIIRVPLCGIFFINLDPKKQCEQKYRDKTWGNCYDEERRCKDMFGEKLKKLRMEKHFTQEELAEKIWVTRTAISKWETNRGYPSH